MFRGAHLVLYSSDPEGDRAFLRDVLGFPYVDAGHDWLIFALPPSEVAVHPADSSGAQELYLMCDDVDAVVIQLATKGVACSPVETQRWGRITRLALPGGGALGVYQPTHPSPLDA